MPEKQTHILFVLEHFHPYVGGIERLFHQLAIALVRKGHRVTVITSRFHKELPLRENMEGVRVIRVRAPNRFLFPFLAIAPAIRKARHCNILQTSTFAAAIPAFIAGKLTGTKTIITVHEYWGNLWHTFPWLNSMKASFFKLAEKALLSLPFRCYIAVSEHTAQSLVHGGWPAEKITMIYNGLDEGRLTQRHPQSISLAGKPHFIYFGRLGHSKGLDLIVEGGSRFLASHTEAVIELIIPDKPARFRKRLIQSIMLTPTADRFVLTPSLSDAELTAKILAATAILIPSYNEGFCYAAAEASFLGIPMVISNRGALAETAGGKVIAMETLSADGLCTAMERAARNEWQIRPVRRFPLEQQVGAYLELYRSL